MNMKEPCSPPPSPSQEPFLGRSSLPLGEDAAVKPRLLVTETEMLGFSRS